MCQTYEALVLGALSSLLATIVWAVITLFAAKRIRKHRAHPFVGKYKMFLTNQSPRHGTVTIRYDDNWLNLLVPTPVLSVIAENATGTEDWGGEVEVLGISSIASGFYRHTDGQGGALRLALSPDGKQITEHGTPYDPQHPDFVKLLVRTEMECQ